VKSLPDSPGLIGQLQLGLATTERADQTTVMPRGRDVFGDVEGHRVGVFFLCACAYVGAWNLCQLIAWAEKDPPVNQSATYQIQPTQIQPKRVNIIYCQPVLEPAWKEALRLLRTLFLARCAPRAPVRVDGPLIYPYEELS